jgi:hypothetical protein
MAYLSIMQPSRIELMTLSRVSIEALSLRYRESRRTDRWGNEFRYHSVVRGAPRETWDVYLRAAPQLSR